MRNVILRGLCGAAAVGVVTVIAAAVATPGDAASVGQPVVLDTKAPPASLGQLKALYRRPGAIPFPKDNPYTTEKAALGKKLYFDTRLSAANLLSCASCHSPAYGWGDGQAKGVGHNMKADRKSTRLNSSTLGSSY